MRHEIASVHREVDALAESLRHHPPRILEALNRRRAELRLPLVPDLRKSSPTPSSPQLEQRTTTRVWLVACPGAAPTPRGHNCPEIILPTAWGTEDELGSGDVFWTIRDGGHDGTAVTSSAGRSVRAYVDQTVGLVVSWVPDLRVGRDRDIVADIEAGRRAVSVAFKRLAVRLDRRGSGVVHVVTRARLAHVAVLRWNERPAYAQASAWVARGGDDPDELRRQRADAVRRALELPTR